jgi:hypothetical protein
MTPINAEKGKLIEVAAIDSCRGQAVGTTASRRDQWSTPTVTTSKQAEHVL